VVLDGIAPADVPYHKGIRVQSELRTERRSIHRARERLKVRAAGKHMPVRPAAPSPVKQTVSRGLGAGQTSVSSGPLQHSRGPRFPIVPRVPQGIMPRRILVAMHNYPGDATQPAEERYVTVAPMQVAVQKIVRTIFQQNAAQVAQKPQGGVEFRAGQDARSETFEPDSNARINCARNRDICGGVRGCLQANHVEKPVLDSGKGKIPYYVQNLRFNKKGIAPEHCSGKDNMAAKRNSTARRPELL